MLFGVTVMTKEGMNLGTRIKPEPLVTHAVERQKKEELIKSFKRIAIRLKTEYKVNCNGSIGEACGTCGGSRAVPAVATGKQGDIDILTTCPNCKQQLNNEKS